MSNERFSKPTREQIDKFHADHISVFESELAARLKRRAKFFVDKDKIIDLEFGKGYRLIR